MNYNLEMLENQRLKTKQKKSRSHLLALFPLLIAVLVMLPRLISPQFGLLDDGMMLAEVRKIMQGDISMSHDLQAGRFRPLYWLYFTLIYTLAGPNPFWFFFGQMLLLLILILQIRVLMKDMGARPWQILITSLIFILSIPIIENFYTLSKGEPLQLVFLLASIIFFERIKSTPLVRLRWLFCFLAFLCVLAALFVKETAIIMIPIVAIWGAYDLFQDKKCGQKKLSAYGMYLGAILLAVAGFFATRHLWGAASITGGTYTVQYDLSIKSLLAKLARWMTLYAFYYHYLLPLIVLAIIIILKSGLQNQKQALFYWLIWCLSWIVLLIPWEFAEVYYLLPFSLGVAILIGLFSPYIKRAILHSRQTIQWTSIVLLSLFTLLFLATLPNLRSDVLTQLTFDRVNQEMIESVEKIIPQNGRAFIGMYAYNEYVRNIQRFLVDQYERTDIQYNFVSLYVLGRLHHSSQGILILPYIRNQPDLSVRAGMEERFTIEWREIITYEMGDRLTELTRFRGEFQIVNINLPIILCPILGERGYCENPDPLIDTRMFGYGWEAYRIR